MTASSENFDNRLTNKFHLLVKNDPNALPCVLELFANSNITPANVNAVSQKNNTMRVSVIVKGLAEDKARKIKSNLKSLLLVRDAQLEHLLN